MAKGNSRRGGTNAIPKAREELLDLADELELREPAAALQLRDIVRRMYRRPPAKPRAAPTARPVTFDVICDVLDAHAADPSLGTRELGAKFGIDKGRVSEILQGDYFN